VWRIAGHPSLRIGCFRVHGITKEKLCHCEIGLLGNLVCLTIEESNDDVSGKKWKQ
jgi:hypothetical protein